MQPVNIIYSQRRSISLELAADGSLTVRAPRDMSQQSVRRFVASKQAWIAKKRAQLEAGQRAWGGDVLTPAELALLKAQAQRDLPARVAQWAPRVGVQPQALHIRTQHTLWGSCSSTGRLSLNAFLMLAPDAVRDYVVVHELCHLKEMNHSARFWAEVEKVLPDYRTGRDWLKANGSALLQRNPKS
ncbi:MAG: SprT family zinc-dependent metalloprotease [Peptococcaceae bacterium]|nr:SprT family zinc-dependent metalloprotease [Peptococcaceae bacterium]